MKTFPSFNVEEGFIPCQKFLPHNESVVYIAPSPSLPLNNDIVLITI